MTEDHAPQNRLGMLNVVTPPSEKQASFLIIQDSTPLQRDLPERVHPTSPTKLAELAPVQQTGTAMCKAIQHQASWRLLLLRPQLFFTKDGIGEVGLATDVSGIAQSSSSAKPRGC